MRHRRQVMGSSLELLHRSRDEPPERNRGLGIAAQIREQSRFESAENMPPGTQRSRERMAGAGSDEVGASGDDPPLGTAEKFVGRKRHQGSPGLEGLSSRGFTVQPCRGATREPPARSIQQAGTEIGHAGNLE